MKANGLKQLKHLFIALLCVLSVGVGFSAPAVAATISRPYFKVYGGDVFAGGAFMRNSTCDNNVSNGYHGPKYSPTLTDQYNGGILSYVKPGNEYAAGSSTNLAGFALGVVKGEAGAPTVDAMWGFFTGYGPSIGSLTFANPPGAGGTSSWGGTWEGTAPQAHCIPDYYSKRSTAQVIASTNNRDVSDLNGSYFMNISGSINTISASRPITANQRITFFVDGDVYISTPITYADQSTYNADSIPKFALVASGNIYVDQSVTRLDGVYIAQPPTNISLDKGTIWTCHDKSNKIPDPAYVKDKCRSQLVVNGAFIAKQVILNRVNGNVASAISREGINGNIAEVFNYTPEMVLGGPFFGSSPSNANNIESLISLPPVF